MRHWIKLFEGRKFVGTCVDSFDNEGDCEVFDLPWSTVSDFANAEENARAINHEEYIELGGVDIPDINGHTCEYLLADEVLILYDTDTDIHYFFV